MAKVEKTRFAVLGLLTLCPMSGYEMRKFYERSLRFFWSESFGQIYPTLKRLEEEGLVRGEMRKGKSGKQSRVYSITDQGRESIRAWLGEPTDPFHARNEGLLKVFFGAVVNPKVIQSQIEDAMQEAEKKLASFQGIKIAIQHENPDPHSRMFHLLTLDYGLKANQMVLEWGREALEKLVAFRLDMEEKNV